uniref:Peptidase M28 domain-containing protein n=1 Tax=Esox lucius TaxID=8010 RepID=A0A6Q2WRL0_ESOLU
SDDVTDDQAGAEQTGQPGDSPSYRPRPRQEYRRICYLALGALFIFVIGTRSSLFSFRILGDTWHVLLHGFVLMTKFVEFLHFRLKKAKQPFDVKILTCSVSARSCLQFQYDQTAGSDGDVILANNVFNNFKIWEMNPWTDVHYVQLQKPDSEKPNRVLMDQVVVGQPKAYLAYSATGKVQGTAVYGNYGRKEDLEILTNLNIELNGTVILLRASGQISLAQQVANVAEMGVSAVLIYPDPDDYKFDRNTELYGHVHLGSGDPYTPGFPSFNHTQFPPTESSGLPTVLAQSITAATAAQIMKAIGGANVPSSFRGGLDDVTYRIGGAGVNVTVEVNNVLQNTEIHNVFGVIKGFVEPDHYVVLGAQRDSWGPGFAKAMVGTTLLMELARSVYEMVEKDGFRPRRSMVFASWSAGEFGSVGATEWLEGYMSSLDRRAFTYISLDGVVTGHGAFKASASPLLVSLLATTMQEVKNPIGSDMSKSLYDKVSGANFEASVLEPMQMEDAAYPFLAFSGIPSISLRFVSRDVYPYYGTALDNIDHLGVTTNQRLDSLATAAGLVAGQMALRLVHDHVLNLDVRRYITPISQAVVKINKRLKQVTEWLGVIIMQLFYSTDIQNTDLTDSLACHKINERIMRVEHNLLSPFVSPKDVPFRHVLFGHGSHTLDAMLEGTDKDVLRTQLALTTWTLQGCANALAGDIWELDNQI